MVLLPSFILLAYKSTLSMTRGRKRSSQNRRNARCGAKVEQAKLAALRVGKTFAMNEWVLWRIECIDLEMEVEKICGQIERVEPASVRLKKLIETLRGHQEAYKKHSLKELQPIYNAFRHVRYRAEELVSKAEEKYKKRLISPNSLELDAKKSSLDGKVYKVSRMKIPRPQKERKMRALMVQMMTLHVQKAEEQLEILIKLEETKPTTPAALAAGSRQPKEKRIKRRYPDEESQPKRRKL